MLVALDAKGDGQASNRSIYEIIFCDSVAGPALEIFVAATCICVIFDDTLRIADDDTKSSSFQCLGCQAEEAVTKCSSSKEKTYEKLSVCATEGTNWKMGNCHGLRGCCVADRNQKDQRSWPSGSASVIVSAIAGYQATMRSPIGC